ncbi:MAG: NADAR family protein [Anaerolineaceae bacterium]
MDVINSFSGEYRFLSNFYPSPMVVDDLQFPAVEHAYVYYKTVDPEWQNLVYEGIQQVGYSAGEIKKIGRKVPLREDWNQVRVPIMRKLVSSKFEQNLDLMEKLQATKPKRLIEGNRWGDTFWGECPLGTGKNMLGKILMEVRDGITNF